MEGVRLARWRGLVGQQVMGRDVCLGRWVGRPGGRERLWGMAAGLGGADVRDVGDRGAAAGPCEGGVGRWHPK